ncbi:MAG: phosphatidate cytidylyltransferase [Candidatus Dormibacteria bacterium]
MSDDLVVVHGIGVRRSSGDLVKRVLSAAVLLAAVIAALRLGAPWVQLVVAGAAGLALAEYYSMCRKAGYAPPWWLLGPLSAYLVFEHDLPRLPIDVVLAMATVGGLALLLLSGQGGRSALIRWALALGGALYIAWLLGYYLRLYYLSPPNPNGFLLVASVAGAAMLGDTAALVAGKAFGRTPFFRRISPRKTVEGAVAGLVVATAFMAITSIGQGVSPGHALLLGLWVGVAAQAGDLVESQIKRMAGVKDSGALIPGHGGMLDRIDSLIFPPVLVYFFLTRLGAS